MKRSLTAATLAAALMLAPMATVNAKPAAPTPAAPTASPIALCPPYCPNVFDLLLEILKSGSSSSTGT